MGEVIDLQKSRLEKIARLAFRGWDKKFNEHFSHTTTIGDMGHEVIRFFALGSPQAMQILQAFVAKCRYTKEVQKSGYEQLDISAKREIIDVSLFILDQMRFEAMFRLGWITDFSARLIPLVELTLNFYEDYNWLQYETPKLHPDHGLYAEYLNVYEADKKSFVRKLIPHVLEVFQHVVPASSTGDDNKLHDR